MLWLSKKNHKSSLRNRDRGFTLIEMLVTMVIIGVLAAIAAPGWLGFVNNQRLSSSQSRVFSTLKDAQSTAKRSGNPTTFTIVNDATNGNYVMTSRSQAQYLEQGVQLLSVVKKVDSATPLSLTPVSPITISFNAQGLPTHLKAGLPPVADADKFPATDFPLRITLNSENSPNRKRCTTITTLLGSVKTVSDTECN